jgi:integrase
VASIKKRPDGSWRARYRDDAGVEHAHHASTRAEAQRWLDGRTAALVRGDYVDPKAGRTTFQEYAEQWRRTRIHAPSTRTSIEHQLRLHVYPNIGDRQLRTILPDDVQALVSRLNETLAPNTVRLIYSRVAAVFRSAVRSRLIASSPCVDIKRPGASPVDDAVLTTEEVSDLAACIPERYAALVLTAAGTGLRPSEVLGLCVDRVDFLRRAVKVDQQLVRAKGGVALSPKLKTAASYRTVPLPRIVCEVLAAHLARWPADPDTGLIFTNESDGPIRHASFAVTFERARKAVTQLPTTPHDLRDYYASLLIRQGLSVKAVQLRLGHASATTTLDRYARLWPDDDERTRDAVDAELGSLADFSRTTGATSS